MKGGSRAPAPQPQQPRVQPQARANTRVGQPVDLIAKRRSSKIYLTLLTNGTSNVNNHRRFRSDQHRRLKFSRRTAVRPSTNLLRERRLFQLLAWEPTDYRSNPQQQNDDAAVLIRAMINAAKSDGQISEAEQQSILERIGNPTQDVIEFLRNEFSQPLDVREFAWSVPLGLEQKVYAISLGAIELDANHEANYLRELAHGLRLTPEICNQIHRQFGAPEIF